MAREDPGKTGDCRKVQRGGSTFRQSWDGGAFGAAVSRLRRRLFGCLRWRLLGRHLGTGFTDFVTEALLATAAGFDAFAD